MANHYYSPQARTWTAMKPHTICIDARFYHTGTGVARYLKGLITHLAAIDTTNHYTVIVRQESVESLKSTLPANWHVAGLEIAHYSLSEQSTLLSYLNQHKFDLVYFTMFNHPILYRGKSIVMIHDLIMHMYPPRPLWHPRTWAYRFMMWHAAHWSDAIITNSQTTTADVVKYLNVPATKCHTIHLAVEDSFKPANKGEVAKTTKKYGITKPYLFFVNAWRPHKGLPELVEAFVKLNRSDLQLVIGGKPNPNFPDVKAVVESAQKSNPNIVTPGFIDDTDLPVLYSGAELYVNPSHYEGFGFGILEAMACGTPVLSADNACLKEVGGNAAIYFKTKSATDLETKMDELLNNPPKRSALVKLGHDRVNNFSFRKMAAQTLDLFNKVLE